MSYFPPGYAPPAPAGPMSLLPMQGGIGGLSGNPLSPLTRGLVGSLAPPPVSPGMVPGFGGMGGLASQVPAGAGAEALTAANALRGGGGAGGLSRAASMVPRAGSIPGAAAMGGKAWLGRAGTAGILGEVGSGLIDATDIGGQNSNLEQGLQGAARGAAAGALVGAPFFGVGAGVGAAVGGVAGGALGVLSNMFGGGGDEEEAPDPTAILAKAINTAQLPPAATEEILTTYETLIALAEAQPEGEMRDAAVASAFDQSAALVLQMMGQKEQAAADASNTLALQAQAQSIFEPLAQDIEDSGAMYAQAMQGIRGSLPEQFRGINDATVARELSSSEKLANAYRAQAAIMPAVDRLTQYQQDYSNFAAQQFSQALAQQAAGGGQAAGPSAQDVLAQLQPA